MFEARSYQTEAVNSVFTYFQSHSGNPIIAMPTGTGKSVVIALFLQRVLQHYPSQRIMVLTHVKELIQQNYEKLMRLWPFAPAGVYSAGLQKRDLHAPITFAGIASVAKKPELFSHVDLVLIDEAHLVSPNEATMYQAFLSRLRDVNPCLKVIGLTATPWRLGHGKLTDTVVDDKGKEVPGLFTDVCFDITGISAFNRLIAEGFLVPLIPKSTALKLDVGGVHIRGGEFIASELQNAVDRQEITIQAVKEAMELGYTREHWLVFASGVEHATHTAAAMNDLGIVTKVVHSKMPDAERDAAIADFKAGKCRAIVNNNILTTGFDFPAIDLILCLRPTASPVLWVQMLGRGTRPAKGKENCLVLDFANNTRRLGPINDPVLPRRKGAKTGDAPVKECPMCACYVHASLRHCNGIMPDGSPCSHEFKFDLKLKQSASTLEIVKGDLPVVEIFKIDHITFTEHRKEGRPVMMKVTYYCRYKAFDEYVCFEHDNYARKKARDWWRVRSAEPVPNMVQDGLSKVYRLRTPTHLRVWINKKYPEILATCFDGTAFGTQAEDDKMPDVDVRASAPAKEFHDEIPF